MSIKMSVGYVLGIGAGILCGIFVAILIAKMTRKDGSVKCKYDERQEIIRGRGFKYGFYTLLIYFALDIFLEELLERFAEQSVILFIGMCLGLAVYAVYGIWNDGYISLNENPTRVIITFILIAVFNFAVSIMRYLLHGDLCVNGVLTLNGINLVCGLLLLVVVFAMLAKQISRRKEDD